MRNTYSQKNVIKDFLPNK